MTLPTENETTIADFQLADPIDVQPAFNEPTQVNAPTQSTNQKLLRLEQSIFALASQLSHLRNEQIQRHRFAGVVALLTGVAATMTIFADSAAPALMNGWMLGTLITASVWFGFSARPILDRIFRLSIATIAVLWVLTNVCDFVGEKLPVAAIVSIFLAPIMMVVARYFSGTFRTSILAPDLNDRPTRPLSIADYLVAALVIASTASYLQVWDTNTGSSGTLSFRYIWMVIVAYVAVLSASVSMTLVAASLIQNRYGRSSILVVLLMAIFATNSLTWHLLAEIQFEQLSWFPLAATVDSNNAQTSPTRLLLHYTLGMLSSLLFTQQIVIRQGYRLNVAYGPAVAKQQPSDGCGLV